MSSLKVIPIKTSIFHAHDSLEEFIFQAVRPYLKEEMIIAITSKIVSVAEQCFVAKDTIDKHTLIKNESDHFLCETSHNVTLTIKHGVLIPSAGIDESNSETGQYILFPKDPYASAKRIYEFIKSRSGLKKLGIIITDSHTTPLRKGVVGIALAHYGFKPIRSFVGDEDLFGRTLKVTAVNALDALAVSAVLLMGESSECQPIAVLTYDQLEFTDSGSAEEIQIPLEEDLYGPLLKAILNSSPNS